MNLTRYLKTFAFLIVISLHTSASEQHDAVSQLHSAILNGNKPLFLKNINAVDSLNVIGDVKEGESLLCAATRQDRAFFLKSLLDAGANPNILYDEVSTFHQLPVLCTMFFDNLEALELLNSYDADLDLMIHTNMAEEFHRSVLMLALGGRRYKHADYIMQRTHIDEDEMRIMQYSVNKFDFTGFPDMIALGEKFKKFLASGTNDYAEFSRTYQP